MGTQFSYTVEDVKYRNKVVAWLNKDLWKQELPLTVALFVTILGSTPLLFMALRWANTTVSAVYAYGVMWAVLASIVIGLALTALAAVFMYTLCFLLYKYLDFVERFIASTAVTTQIECKVQMRDDSVMVQRGAETRVFLYSLITEMYYDFADLGAGQQCVLHIVGVHGEFMDIPATETELIEELVKRVNLPKSGDKGWGLQGVSK